MMEDEQPNPPPPFGPDPAPPQDRPPFDRAGWPSGRWGAKAEEVRDDLARTQEDLLEDAEDAALWYPALRRLAALFAKFVAYLIRSSTVRLCATMHERLVSTFAAELEKWRDFEDPEPGNAPGPHQEEGEV